MPSNVKETLIVESFKLLNISKLQSKTVVKKTHISRFFDSQTDTSQGLYTLVSMKEKISGPKQWFALCLTGKKAWKITELLNQDLSLGEKFRCILWMKHRNPASSGKDCAWSYFVSYFSWFLCLWSKALPASMEIQDPDRLYTRSQMCRVSCKYIVLVITILILTAVIIWSSMTLTNIQVFQFEKCA